MHTRLQDQQQSRQVMPPSICSTCSNSPIQISHPPCWSERRTNPYKLISGSGNSVGQVCLRSSFSGMGFRARLSYGRRRSVFLKPLSLEQSPEFHTAPVKDYPQVIRRNLQDFANLV